MPSPAEPYVSEIEFPAVAVTRAIFDRKKRALIVSLKAGTENRGRSWFQVNQLDFKKRCTKNAAVRHTSSNSLRLCGET